MPEVARQLLALAEARPLTVGVCVVAIILYMCLMSGPPRVR